jgi:predicted DNA binding protein
MDITSPTFQQHLRAAHRKLLDAYVDEEPRRSGDSADGG